MFMKRKSLNNLSNLQSPVGNAIETALYSMFNISSNSWSPVQHSAPAPASESSGGPSDFTEPSRSRNSVKSPLIDPVPVVFTEYESTVHVPSMLKRLWLSEEESNSLACSEDRWTLAGMNAWPMSLLFIWLDGEDASVAEVDSCWILSINSSIEEFSESSDACPLFMDNSASKD